LGRTASLGLGFCFNDPRQFLNALVQSFYLLEQALEFLLGWDPQPARGARYPPLKPPFKPVPNLIIPSTATGSPVRESIGDSGS
jgi:hypothetical protein